MASKRITQIDITECDDFQDAYNFYQNLIDMKFNAFIRTEHKFHGEVYYSVVVILD